MLLVESVTKSTFHNKVIILNVSVTPQNKCQKRKILYTNTTVYENEMQETKSMQSESIKISEFILDFPLFPLEEHHLNASLNGTQVSGILFHCGTVFVNFIVFGGIA